MNPKARFSLHSANAQPFESQHLAAPLDSIDLGIVRILQADGRASSVKMAGLLNQPVTSVRAKLGDLLSRGIVEVRAVTHPSTLGLRAMGLVSVHVKTGFSVSELAESLLEVPEVDYVATCMGSRILVEVVARDSEEMAGVVELRIHMADAVDSLEVSPYFNLH